MKKFKNKIFVLSASRTGSTFLWQVLKYLCEDVEKLHCEHLTEEIIKSKSPMVITRRNCMDSFASYIRIAHFKGRKEEFLNSFKTFSTRSFTMEHENKKVRVSYKDFLVSSAKIYRMQLGYMRHFIETYDGKKLVLDYENFLDDYDYVFSKLEEFLQINISNDLKKIIINNTNRDANKKIQSSFDEFKEYHKESHIHGHHIAFETNNYSKELFPEEEYKFFENLLNFND